MSTPGTAPQQAASRAAVDMSQAVNLRASNQYARYVEGRTQERAAYRAVRELTDSSLLRHLSDTQLTALERNLKGLRLEADLQAGRAKDVVAASTDLIDAVIAEWRTR